MTDTENTETTNVTPDGGVKKRIIRNGEGEVPTLHARCLVHYVGRIQGGDVFIDTHTDGQAGEPATLVAGRDAVTRERGLSLAVATMQSGEKALVQVDDPAYGYGQQGSFSFPSVPGNAKLEYDLELLGWEEVQEGAEASSMLFEERLEAAERRRLDGNSLFGRGSWSEALGKYALALSHVDEELMMQVEGFHYDKVQSIRTLIQLNMAACQIRLQDYHTAVSNCSQVLAHDKDNAKAYFRRGKARALLGQTEEALRDLEAAARLAPEDRGITRELQQARQALREEQKAAAQVFKSAFKRLAESGEALADIGAGAAAGQRQGRGQGGAGGGAAAAGSSRGGGWGLFGWLARLLESLQRALLMLVGRRQVQAPA